MAAVSPDGKLLVCRLANSLDVYDLCSGTPLFSQPIQRLTRMTPDLHCPTNFNGAAICSFGYSLRNLPQFTDNIEPLVTATRIFRYQLDDPELQKMLETGGPLPSGYQIPGESDDELITICLNCGKRFAVPQQVDGVIEELLQSAGISPDQSPCLHLPDEAWHDPRLRCQCEHCQQPLRLNPFSV